MLKTTLSKDGRLVYSAEDAAHDARRAHQLQAAYEAAIRALEASQRDRERLAARVAEVRQLRVPDCYSRPGSVLRQAALRRMFGA